MDERDVVELAKLVKQLMRPCPRCGSNRVGLEGTRMRYVHMNRYAAGCADCLLLFGGRDYRGLEGAARAVKEWNSQTWPDVHWTLPSTNSTDRSE